MNDSLPFWVAVAAGMIRCATPVLLATVGECITERSGVLNLGLEGTMLAGALSAVVVSYCTHSVVLAIAIAMLVGAIIGLLHACICIKFQANQVASGIAMTILLSGITAFFGADFVGKPIQSVVAIKLPFLCDIPLIGPILFNQDPLVYLCYLIVPLTYWLINHTRFGLSLRAVGEEPRAAAAAGIQVRRVRYISTMLGAALAALGGAYLSLVYAQGWIENITAGRGWVAVGLVVFAAWNPWRALIGAYLFGLAVSLQLRLQAAGCEVSPYLLGMLPYLLVISVMAGSSIIGRKKAESVPTALGVSYAEQA
jgi:simple sugar transport system permease protein